MTEQTNFPKIIAEMSQDAHLILDKAVEVKVILDLYETTQATTKAKSA